MGDSQQARWTAVLLVLLMTAISFLNAGFWKMTDLKEIANVVVSVSIIRETVTISKKDKVNEEQRIKYYKEDEGFKHRFMERNRQWAKTYV